MPSPALPARTRLLYLLLLPLLISAKEGKGCKGCIPDPGPDAIPVDTKIDVAQTLQVVSMNPSEGAPGTSLTARIDGAGFAAGATVKVGPASMSGLSVVDANTIRGTIPGLPAGSYDVIVRNPDGVEAKLRGGLTIVAPVDANVSCTAITVYFDFDKFVVRDDARIAIDSQIACLQRLTGRVQLDGHADERGTTDYNLSLGEKRADTVRRYLAGAGVPGSRIRVTSYGEERPASNGHDDAAFALNRRVEIHADR